MMGAGRTMSWVRYDSRHAPAQEENWVVGLLEASGERAHSLHQGAIPHTGISRNRGITGVLSKATKLDFHHGRQQPYLILPIEATFFYLRA